MTRALTRKPAKESRYKFMHRNTAIAPHAVQTKTIEDLHTRASLSFSGGCSWKTLGRTLRNPTQGRSQSQLPSGRESTGSSAIGGPLTWYRSL